MRDNKCDFPHRQSWDKRNRRPSEFCVFFDHPSQRSPKTTASEQNIGSNTANPPLTQETQLGSHKQNN